MRFASFVSLVLCAHAAAAQSTDHLRRPERPLSIQAAVGRSWTLFDDWYGGQVGPLQAVDLAVLGRADGGMALRGDVWLLRNRGVNRYAFSGNPTQTHAETTLVVGVGIGGEFRLSLPYDITIDAIGSAGVVPYARGIVRDRRDAFGSSPAEDRRTSRVGKGWYLSPGVAVRWKYFVVQQHVIQIFGADVAVLNGENAPLTIGVRW